MPESAKDMQGKLKEKAGEAGGDDRLKHEGQAEQAGEKVKSGVDKVVDKAKDVIER